MADFFQNLTDALQSLGGPENRSDIRRAREIKEMTDQLAEQAKQPGFDPMTNPLLRELSIRAPGQAQSIQDNFMKMDKRRRDAMYRDAIRARAFYKTGQPDKARELFSNRRNDVLALGGDPSDVDRVAQIHDEQGPEAGLEELDAFLDAGRQLGHLPRELAEKSYQPQILEKTLPDGTTVKQMAIPTFDPNTNEATWEVLALPEGFEAVAETPEEKRLREIEKERKLSADERKADLVKRGTLAAEGLADVKRALDLLDRVETGGLDNWGNAIRNFFGVQGADEGELSTALGKSMLSKLRDTFGAAFTVEELKRLERIEAGMGKSPASNRRLLANAAGIIERAANRGIKAAKELGDDFAVQDIESLLQFELNPEAYLGMRSVPTNATDEELQNRKATLEAKSGP